MLQNKATVLLTGATGFLGSYLLEALLRQQYEVIILKRTFSDEWRIKQNLINVKSYDIDVFPVSKAFEEQHIDLVIHTACHYGRNSDSLAKVVDCNVRFALEVLESSIKHNVKYFLNTDTLLSKHLSGYSLSKSQFLEWLKSRTNMIKVVNLKLEHMYGVKDDNKKLISWFLSELDQNIDEIKLTYGEQRRDFVYIDDVVEAYLKVIANLPNLPSFSEFQVGTGKSSSVKHFLTSLRKEYELQKGQRRTKLSFGAIPYRENEPMEIKVKNDSLLDLGWSPNFDVEKGIERLIHLRTGTKWL